MIKIKVNLDIIKSLNPCESRLNNYIEYHSNFEGDLIEFLQLDNVISGDKIWVAVRLMPKFLVEVFTIDCVMTNPDMADQIDVSVVTYVFSDVGNMIPINLVTPNATAYTAVSTASVIANSTPLFGSHFYSCLNERKRQIASIIWLLENTTKKELKECSHD